MAPADVADHMHRVHLVIQGRVQGVGYRYFVLRRAQEMGLHGWVCNRADGAVEAEAEGDREALTRFIDALRGGPSGAHVAGIHERWTEAPPEHTRFLIRSSAGS